MIPIYYNEYYRKYSFGPLHPFDPVRFPRFVELVNDTEAMTEVFEVRKAVEASLDDLSLVHSEIYIKKVLQLEKIGGRVSPDTPVKKGAPKAAMNIVGGTIQACRDAAESGSAVNLGGLHHAGRDYGEGFCLFNDVAVGAQMLADEGKKVCVFDTDAHQGNGTMDVFYQDPRVLFISIHQDPATLYPGRGYVHEVGKGAGKGYTVNIPMPRDAHTADHAYGIDKVVEPIVKKFAPHVIIRNGGSDPHHSDTLTDLGLDMTGLEYLGRVSKKLAQENNAGHVELLLSGYGPRVIEGWLAILKGAFDPSIETPDDKVFSSPEDPPSRAVRKTIEELDDILSAYW